MTKVEWVELPVSSGFVSFKEGDVVWAEANVAQQLVEMGKATIVSDDDQRQPLEGFFLANIDNQGATK
jgi:hypothetical protein